MTNFEIRDCLDSMVILCDTREQPTERLKRRLEATGLPYERKKLDAGDYSCKCTLPDGGELDFSTRVVIERKYDLTEICTCFGKERQRFEREFLRAKENGTRIYLLIENATWENVFAGKYRSKYASQALVASLLAWQTRYDMKIVFCKSETTGKLIKEILFRELKQHLEEKEDS